MLTTTALGGFALICLGMVLSPGPNMMYLVSRSICQGRQAGLISLTGIAMSFIVWLAAAILGISALLFAVPFAYDALRFAGALYLGWLAWQTLRPGGRSPFQVTELPPDSPRRLVAMGFITGMLNPKAAILYLSLLPQFFDPQAGSILAQGLTLGLIQVSISLTVNSLIVCTAGAVAALLSTRPGWARLQRYLMGSMLGALSLRMALEARK